MMSKFSINIKSRRSNLVVFQACKDKDFLCVCPFSVINIKTEYCLDPSSYQGI